MKKRLFAWIVLISFVLSNAGTQSALAQDEVPPPYRHSEDKPASPSHPPAETGVAKDGTSVTRVPGTAPAILQDDLSPQTVAATPGLSFRYLQEFGTNSEPYLADGSHLNRPSGLFVDGSNNLFVTEERGHRVLKFNSSGTNTLTLGQAGIPWSHDQYIGNPKDIVTDGDGNIWVLINPSLKKFDSAGTFLESFPYTDAWQAGTDNSHFSNEPWGMAFGPGGFLYVSDTNNNRIQIMDVSGTPAPSTPTISYVATIGTGFRQTDNTGFAYPTRIDFDSTGKLYVMDSDNARVQRCSSTDATDPVTNPWTCTTFFGETGVWGSDLTHLDWASGITIDSSDNIFIADGNNYRVLKCNTTPTCSLFAGVTLEDGSDNARFAFPSDIAVDSSNNVYVSDSDNARVQKFDSAGVYQSTLGATLVPYLTDASHIYDPQGIAVAPDGSMYVTEGGGNRLLKFNAAGVQQWTVGEAGVGGSDIFHLGNRGGGGPQGNPAIDASGRIYVSDSDNNRVQIFNSNGTFYATLGGSWGFGTYKFRCMGGVAISPVNGDIFVVDRCNNRVQVYTSARVYKATLGVTNVAGSDNSHFSNPWGVAVDGLGNIYVGDSDNYRVQKCTLGGGCSTFAGVTGVQGGDFGHFQHPEQIAVDSSNRVYVVDAWYPRVQVFDSTGAYLTTLGGGWGPENGNMTSPRGVAVDASGNVYVTDTDTHRIQKFARGTPNWQQVNINGFGDISHGWITSMAAFGDKLFAGVEDVNTGGQIWQSTNGTTWTAAMSNGFGDISNVDIDHMLSYNGYLYAGTGNYVQPNWASTNGGQLWRSLDGSAWDQVTPLLADGYDAAANSEFFHLAEFNGHLYAGTAAFDNHGAEIWRCATCDGTDWVQVEAGGFGDGANGIITSFESLGTSLYAATWNSNTGGEVWRSASGAAGTWVQVNPDGFGDAGNRAVSSMSAFGGYLYAATDARGAATGSEVWRCQVCNNTDWTQVVNNGLGDSNSKLRSSLAQLGGSLYLVIGNNITGMNVWRTLNGTTWTPSATNGFGNRNNMSSYFDNSVTTFKTKLYVGASNWVNGAQVWSGFTPVQAHIGGTLRGTYFLAPGSSARQNYAGVDAGPVKVMSTDGTPIIAAIRDAWAVNGVTTSFSQLMGLPLEQLSNKYVFPGYNNVTLNDQLRIANVDTVLSVVTVTIGGVPRGTYPLVAGAAVRINYAGLDSGPVVVQGTAGVKIIAAIREAWSVNGVTKSFVQLMGLPAGQLSNKYVFPAYNNVTVNEQLRIGNVDPALSTVVTVTIGGTVRGTYPLGPGAAVRINYAGLDSGPVVIEGLPSTVPIISSIRSAWSVNGVITSFAQLMGMPAEQLSNKYLFPAYNNVTLNDQLRIANVDTNPTVVTVTIGGVPRGTYPLAAGGTTRINYAGLDSGPVVVEGTPSTVKIISAIREAWSVNGAIQSFVQLMGLPAGQLSSTYLFPAYNNVTLNEQLRFGVP